MILGCSDRIEKNVNPALEGRVFLFGFAPVAAEGQVHFKGDR